MNERQTISIMKMREKIDEGINTGKIDHELGVWLLGTLYDISKYELPDKKLKAVDDIVTEIRGVTKEIHELNKKLAKWR